MPPNTVRQWIDRWESIGLLHADMAQRLRRASIAGRPGPWSTGVTATC